MKRKSAPSVCSGPSRAVALAVLCGLASGASAQMWDGGAGSLLWTDGDNWEPDGVPGTMDDVLIDVPGVLIASIVAEVNSLSAPQLSMTSANLIVHDISTIDGLTVGGCCVTTIESNAMFTLTGVSEFSRAANFRGSGPFNLMQNQIFLEGFFVQGGTTVEIKGSASLVTNGSVRSNGVARVTGDLNLTTSLIEAQTDGVWELAGGTISKFGTGTATITAPLRMTAGEIVADGGTLDITGRVNFEAGTLSIANGGKIEMNNGSSPTLNVTRYEGDGDSIEIRGTYDLLSDGGSATSTVTGIRGLYLRNNATIGGTLTVEEQLTTFGTIFSGPGKLLVNGTWGDYGSTYGVETEIGPGGEIVLFASSRFEDRFVVGPAGTFSLQDGATLGVVTGSEAEFVVQGQLQTLLSTAFKNITLNAPVTVDGGAFLNPWAAVRFTRGVDFKNAIILLRPSNPGEVLASVNLDALTSFPIRVSGDLTIEGYGGVYFGTNGDSDAPAVIDGTITNRHPVVSSIVAEALRQGFWLRTPTTGNGLIENRGAMFVDIFNKPLGVRVRNRSEGELSFLTFTPVSALVENIGEVDQPVDIELDRGSIINSGTWDLSARIRRSEAAPEIETFTNIGLLQVRGSSGPLGGSPTFVSGFVDVPFDNAGRVFVEYGTVSFVDPMAAADTALPSGKWEAGPEGIILFPNLSLQEIRGEGTEVIGDGESTPWFKSVERVRDRASVQIGDIVTDGSLSVARSSFELRINSTVETDSMEISDGGDVKINANATLKSSGPVDVGSEISVPSVIDDITGVVELARGARLMTPPTVEAPAVNLRGRLTPSVDGPGAFRIAGDLAMFDRGRLAVTVDQGGVSDFVEVTGSASLDGMIELEVAMGYTPSLGDSFTVLTAGVGVSGAIDRVVVDTGTAGVRWVPSVVGNSLVVAATTPADLAAPIGTIDVFDLIAFLQGFDPNDPSCDGSVVPCSLGDLAPAPSGDGFLDVFDLIAFLQAFEPGPVGAGGGS